MAQLAAECKPTFRPGAPPLRWGRVDGTRALTAIVPSLTVRRGSGGLPFTLLTDLTTRGLPGSFWQTSRGSSPLHRSLTLPGLEGCSFPPGGSPSPSWGLWSLQGVPSHSSKGCRWAPKPLVESGFGGGLILMTMF